MCACAPALRAVISREIKSIFIDKTRRKQKIKQVLRMDTPDINELSPPPQVRSPSFDAVHTLSLTERQTEGMGVMVAVAYEGNGLGLDVESNPRAPRTPTLTRPERVLRLSGFSRMSGFSRFASSISSSPPPPLPQQSLLSSSSKTPLRQPEPEMVEREISTNRTAPLSPEIDPAMDPKFVACRGCGGYHEHGFSHGNSRSRSSLTVNWWGRGTERIKSWRASRRQSISVYGNPDELRNEDW
jgi:hypothetical protein